MMITSRNPKFRAPFIIRIVYYKQGNFLSYIILKTYYQLNTVQVLNVSSETAACYNNVQLFYRNFGKE